MIEVLPIKFLTDSDATIFGSLNTALGRLHRQNLSVGSGIVVTAPDIRLKTTLEHFDLGSKEIFEQSLHLIKKEIEKIEIPENLLKELKGHDQFLVNNEVIKSQKQVWIVLLHLWLEEIKARLWKDGFTLGLTQNLEPQIVTFIKKLDAFGTAYEEPLEDDVIINIHHGKLTPAELKKLDELIRSANKKLLIPHTYSWVLDGQVKLTAVRPYTTTLTPVAVEIHTAIPTPVTEARKSAIKVFLDGSNQVYKDVDGIYLSSEKIFDLNKPQESFEELIIKIDSLANTFPNSPILVKLADKSEGMGKVRGSLRLLHQESLFNPLMEALDFIRHKKGLTNVHIVIPFVRTPQELSEIKRALAVKKLMRKHSLEQWMEIAVPENIINLENYLETSLDGVIFNLDELIAHLNGFDHTQEDLTFYKNEVSGLIKFLDDSLKLLHKAKVPFIAAGSLVLYPQVLEFLITKGVYGVVVDFYETHSIKDLLHNMERRVILKKSI